MEARDAPTALDNDIFSLALRDEHSGLEALVVEGGCSPDDRDDYGRTALMICATYGCEQAAQKLISLGASLQLQDYENGWTALHRALYHGHLKVSLLLIKGGADLGDQLRAEDWKTAVCPKKEPNRCIRTAARWRSPIDHDGLSPLDLLSLRLQNNLLGAKESLLSTSVYAFGKSDFKLGVQLPRVADIVRPKIVDSLSRERVVQVVASKHHSLALCASGRLFSWGHGKSGRLGHGNENSYPEPAVITALESVSIVSVAAGENHTLAVSRDGQVYSWGSGRFGALGHGDLGIGLQCLEPRKIDALKKQRVLGIAAGCTHSLCFTANNDIYVWGSNKHGQLSLRPGDCSSLPNGVGHGLLSPKRILLSSLREDVCEVIALAAGTFNSLALVRAASRTNSVYQWGHGGCAALKVRFSNINISPDRKGKAISGPFAYSKRVEIVAISAGQSHNCALSDHGIIWTWGLGSDQLGHGTEANRLSSPHIVEALLPENGGGRVTGVSACSMHTCVVTDCGDVYSWGSSLDSGSLGHGEATFQPVPRRVVGIKRAVQVATSADHTLVLCAASVPKHPHFEKVISDEIVVDASAPEDEEKRTSRDTTTVSTSPDGQVCYSEPLTLLQSCEATLAKTVDIVNVAQMLEYATILGAPDLALFCSRFILMNLDAVLTQNRLSDLDILISEIIESVSSNFVRPSILSRNGSMGSAGNKSRSNSATSVFSDASAEDDICRYRCPAKTLMSLEGINKFSKSIRKKLAAVLDLEAKIASGEIPKESLQTEQLDKLHRRQALESELKRLEPIVMRLEMEDGVKARAIAVRKQKSAEAIALSSSGDSSSSDVPCVPSLSPKDDDCYPEDDDRYLTKSISPRVIQSPGDTNDLFTASKSTANTSTSIRKKKKVTLPFSPSFADWLTFTSPNVESTPAADAPMVNVLLSASSHPWGSQGEAKTTIALKDVIAEQSTTISVILSGEASKIVSNAPLLRTPVKSPACPSELSSSGKKKKEKISLSEFLERTEKATTRVSPLSTRPWGVPTLGSPEGSNVFQGSPAVKLTFAEIQEHEEKMRVESNISSLSGNENPWFIDRRPRTESIDKIMKAQLHEKTDTTNHSSVKPLVSTLCRGSSLNASAADFIPCALLLQEQVRDQNKTKMKKKKERKGETEEANNFGQNHRSAPKGNKKKKGHSPNAPA